MWGELASHKRLFNPPPQFSRLGTWCPALMFCMSNICERMVSIDVCGFYIYLCMGVIGCWVISPFFLSIVSMAGVLCTMAVVANLNIYYTCQP